MTMNFILLLLTFFQLIQCETNTSIDFLIPSLVHRFKMNVPLSEQAMYDLRNTLRLSSVIDYPDGESSENPNDDDADEQMESNPPQSNEFIQSSTTTTTNARSSSFHITSHRMNNSSLIFCLIFYFNLI